MWECVYVDIICPFGTFTRYIVYCNPSLGRARQNPKVISPGSHISGPQEVKSLQLAINFH